MYVLIIVWSATAPLDISVYASEEAARSRFLNATNEYVTPHSIQLFHCDGFRGEVSWGYANGSLMEAHYNERTNAL